MGCTVISSLYPQGRRLSHYEVGVYLGESPRQATSLPIRAKQRLKLSESHSSFCPLQYLKTFPCGILFLLAGPNLPY